MAVDPENPTETLPLKVSQRTPSVRARQPKQRITGRWVLLLVVLFVMSVAVGFAVRRLVSTQTAGPRTDNPG